MFSILKQKKASVTQGRRYNFKGHAAFSKVRKISKKVLKDKKPKFKLTKKDIKIMKGDLEYKTNFIKNYIKVKIDKIT